jgi:hypothetical protein
MPGYTPAEMKKPGISSWVSGDSRERAYWMCAQESPAQLDA